MHLTSYLIVISLNVALQVRSVPLCNDIEICLVGQMIVEFFSEMVLDHAAVLDLKEVIIIDLQK